MSIEVRNVSKAFGSFRALHDVSLRIDGGELVALLGPSGSGKTTLLRVIAGLQTPEVGSVLFDGQDATDRNVKDRRVGFVFQHYALFRHMSVFENVAFGLRVMPRRSRPTEGEIRTRVMDLLKLVQVDWLANQYPAQLSGGQRQRVALARALVIQPRVLLLDEPFGALDAKVRRELRRWLRKLHDELHVTSVFVTHDQEEALEVSDRVVIMDKGQIVQVGAPEQVYDSPATPFVYEFLGNVNFFHCRLEPGRADLGGVSLPIGASVPWQGEKGRTYVRPQDFELSAKDGGDAFFPAEVAFVSRVGPLVRLELAVGDGQLVHAEVTHESYESMNARGEFAKGCRIHLRPRRYAVFPDWTPEASRGGKGELVGAAPPAPSTTTQSA